MFPTTNPSASAINVGTTVVLPPLPTTISTTKRAPAPTTTTTTNAGDVSSTVTATATVSDGGGDPGSGGGGGEDEGVLRDVLDELDRERSKRAELEAQTRKLYDELIQAKEENDRIQQEQLKLMQKQEEEMASKKKMIKEERPPKPESSNNKESPTSATTAPEISRREFLAMKAQVEGYQQLVDAITSTRPAVAVAAASSTSSPRRLSMQQKKTIPIHILRLLEIMPWDPTCLHYIFGYETIYEWQIYDTREKKWQNQLRYFPTVPFKNLSIVKSTNKQDTTNQSDKQQQIQSNNSNTADRKLLLFLAGAAATASGGASSVATNAAAAAATAAGGGGSNNVHHGVLTDERCTKMYNVQSAGDGFPFHEERAGSWEWVGGWRLVKRSQQQQRSTSAVVVSANSIPNNNTNDNNNEETCDEHGWRYAKEVHQFLLSSTKDLVRDSPFIDGGDKGNNGSIQKSTTATTQIPTCKVRRRKWIRRRILVDYPYASERTLEYLKLLVENARLCVSVDKVSDQLVETKTTLTETEEQLIQVKADLEMNEALLLKADPAAVAAIRASTIKVSPASAASTGLPATIAESIRGGEGEAATPLQGLLAVAKNEQVKELGSKISQWVQSARKPSDDYTSSTAAATETAASEEKKSSAIVDNTTTNTNADSGELPSSSSAAAAAESKFNWNRIGPIAFTKKPAWVESASRSASAEMDEEGEEKEVPSSNA